jgi:predicted neuraminidase
VIQELASGDIVVGWYAGEDEARPDAAYVLARRRPGADRFDPLAIVADTPGKPEGNGILFQVASGELLLIHGTMHGELDGPPGPGVRWETCDLKIRRSTDDGRTWTEDEMIAPDLGHVPHCKPIRMSNGEIIFGTEYTGDHSRFWISGDEGRTWTMTGSVPGKNNEQPAIIERADGSLLALLRPDDEEPRIYSSSSFDNGRTWTPTERTPFACPYSAIDAVKLSDGRIVLAWNRDRNERNPLALAMSEDEGETWPYVRDLVTGEGEFHYPAIVQSADGLLHISFTNNRTTIDHVVLTPDWIMGKGDALPPWTSAGRRTI